MTAYRPVPPGSQPPYAVASYGSTALRAPHQPLVAITPTIEQLAPTLSPALLPAQIDLSREAGGAALGERIIVAGRVTDEAGRPVARTMIELWQANAAGRYHHERDTHDAPLDPHFRGAGRVFTDDDGRYRFVTIKPGAYPWRNHANAWRPNHIHFSLFGASWGARLVTQMYFPGDPLLAIDPIYQAVPDAAARERLVAVFDLALTEPAWALGYRFDLVLRGLHATPMEVSPVIATASQTIGPFWHALADPALADLTRLGATGDVAENVAENVAADVIELAGQIFDGSGAPVSDACVELWQATPRVPGFVGWGRCATDAHGGFAFRTLAPDPRAPYLAVAILARGLVKPLWTRVYLADTGDALLAQLPAARRATLLAQPEPPRWRWNIRLQGDGETVFLEL